MVVLTVEQMGHIVSLIPIFYRSSIFQIILLASSRGGGVEGLEWFYLMNSLITGRVAQPAGKGT